MSKFIELDSIIGPGPKTRRATIRVSDISMILDEDKPNTPVCVVLANGHGVHTKQTCDEIIGLMATLDIVYINGRQVENGKNAGTS